MTERLKKKVDRAIRLLQAIPTEDGPIEVAYSGGKDSDVCLELTKMAGINYRAIYKMTTIDPIGTIKHCKDMGVEIRRPEQTFLQLIEKRGKPSRFRRFCCGVLKEYPILPRAIMGVRADESTARAKRYHEPEECRIYKKMKGKPKVRAYYPILDWTLEDVAEFIEERGIKCAPVYYDEQGKFHPERRLGCIGCPLASQTKQIEQWKQYPQLLNLVIKRIQRYYNNRGGGKISEDVFKRNAWNLMYSELFCKNSEDYIKKTTGMFPLEQTPEEFMRDYFRIKKNE